MIGELGATIVGFGELVLLDHRAHGPVEHDDPLCEQLLQPLEGFRTIRLLYHVPLLRSARRGVQ